MTIREQANYILDHPAWKSALADRLAMEDLLIHLQLHVCDIQVKASAREYGNCRRMNSSDIKEALLGIKPPSDFNLYLKIPEFKEECVVVSLPVVAARKKAARYFNPLQLSLWPEWEIRAALTN